MSVRSCNATHVYKMKHEPSSSYLHNLFPVRHSTSHLLRSNLYNDFDIPRPNTDKFNRSFQYSGARLWNGLPANVKNAKSL